MPPQRRHSAARPPWRLWGGSGVGAAPGHRDTPGTSAGHLRSPGAKARDPRPSPEGAPSSVPPAAAPGAAGTALPARPPPACPARAGPARSCLGSRERWAELQNHRVSLVGNDLEISAFIKSSLRSNTAMSTRPWH